MKDLKELKRELKKIEGWKANAKSESDLMTINYFYNITAKQIKRIEGEK